MTIPESYKKVHDSVVEYIKAHDPEKIFKSSELYAALKDEFINLTESSFKTYLSAIAGSDWSEIRSKRSKGYYLIQRQETQEEEFENNDTNTSENTNEIKIEHAQEDRKKKETEKLMYPILQSWLEARGYSVFGTHNKKKNKKWGNPDITGVRIDEMLGIRHIEIITLEAKVSSKNFREDFFEAVSHRRFANRAYYVFASGVDFFELEHYEELLYYSDLYNVGLILMYMSEEYYKKFQNCEIDQIDPDEVEIIMINSPSPEIKNMKYQKRFLDSMGIEASIALSLRD